MTNARFMLSPSLVSVARADMIAGIDARKELEKTLKSGLPLNQITATLASHAKRIEKADAFTIAYLAQAALHVVSENDNVTGTALFSSFFTMQARSNACLNEKAIPRVLTISRLLNGGTINRSSADEEATACVIDALRSGMTSGSDIKRAMRLSMIAGTFGNGKRVDWNAEGTQGSSSLRALLVTGIVSRDGAQTWNVRDAAAFERLCDGIDGKGYEGETIVLNDLPTRAPLALTHDAGNSDAATAVAPVAKAKRARRVK